MNSCRRGCCVGRSNPGYSWLICGTGYSGTKWAATILTKLGFHTVHESPLTYNGWMSTPPVRQQGVSTPYALPRHCEDLRTLLIVRHPARWYATVNATNLFGAQSDHRHWIDRHFSAFDAFDALPFWIDYNTSMMQHVDQITTLEEITSDPEHAAAVFANLTRGRIDPRHVFDLMADVGVVNTHYEPMREAEELWATL